MPWVFEVGTHSAKPVFRTNVSQVHIDAVEIVPDGLCVRNRMRVAFSADGTESTKPRTPNISDGGDLPERKVEEPKEKSIRERVARRRWATNALRVLSRISSGRRGPRCVRAVPIHCQRFHRIYRYSAPRRQECGSESHAQEKSRHFSPSERSRRPAGLCHRLELRRKNTSLGFMSASQLLMTSAFRCACPCARFSPGSNDVLAAHSLPRAAASCKSALLLA